MRNQFTVFDVETANASSASICSIGIATVKDNVIIDEFYSLIDPETYFSSSNIEIHGITKDDVVNAPTFSQIWPQIRHYFEDQLVLAHFASFDIGCLRATLDRYGLDHPDFTYSCTCILGRKLLPHCHNHKLNTIAAYYGFFFEHHNAMEDARVTAQIAIRYLEANDTDDMDELHKRYQVKYKSFLEARPASFKTKTPIPQPDFAHAREDHPFYRKHVCITGTLKENRADVYQKLANVGAFIDENLTIHTDYLVIGTFKKISSKMKAAQRFVDEGQLQIIDETKFYEMLDHLFAHRTSYASALKHLAGSMPLLLASTHIACLYKSKILLIKADGYWTLPGGYLEPGETLEESASQNFAGQTSQSCPELDYLKVFSGADFRDPEEDIYHLCHLFVHRHETEPETSEDHGQYFDLSTLPVMDRCSLQICQWLIEHLDETIKA